MAAVLADEKLHACQQASECRNLGRGQLVGSAATARQVREVPRDRVAVTADLCRDLGVCVPGFRQAVHLADIRWFELSRHGFPLSIVPGAHTGGSYQIPAVIAPIFGQAAPAPAQTAPRRAQDRLGHDLARTIHHTKPSGRVPGPEALVSAT